MKKGIREEEDIKKKRLEDKYMKRKTERGAQEEEDSKRKTGKFERKKVQGGRKEKDVK